MTPAHQILVGDCLELLRAMPDESVHCCITSPPYFGLRDYGMAGQIGLEKTPAEFVARLVEVFREVRRVLRADGTLWVNIGDSYASGGRGGGGRFMTERRDGAWKGRGEASGWRSAPKGLKHKDLVGIPWRLAFALQDDGWYLRQDIIWHKSNPMPESVRDRCTKAHEYLFMLSKSPRYYFDREAIAEPLAPASTARLAQGAWEQQRGSATPGKSNGAMKAVGGSRSKRYSFARETKNTAGTHGQKAQHRPDRPDIDYSETRNKRSVWSVSTAGFKGAHFATFPPDLIRPCVLAGAPRDGLILDPFGGAGTTGLVAMQEGRRSVLLELNPEYAAIARTRLATAWIEGAAQLDIFNDDLRRA
ncbi:DNA modification methylase [Pseudomonas citronellolis]|uniref:Methyltransferase n=1 Tax=Pseudomonas citronellolis TaxID=53408 RepID=A0AAQ1KFP4_9PSED|nr:site-specific DNA-methyltransferase [Pseudomonas citronellolis]TGC30799.1 site-specific DNA-methyltransferase [Pseudomonas citronellolis]SFC83753.1 DNA modification methylase [Pseudomonas citronellolis]